MTEDAPNGIFIFRLNVGQLCEAELTFGKFA
jgi:hypothetical protein